MATSVTGIKGNTYSEHLPIGVSKLIGPRWDETKEQEFQRMKRTLRILVPIFVLNVIFNLVFLAMVIL